MSIFDFAKLVNMINISMDIVGVVGVATVKRQKSRQVRTGR